MEGEVVRLEQGDAKRRRVYSSHPAQIARQWEDAGGDWLHVVDLDAAFTGISKNLEVFAEIVSAVSIPCQIGGGMRDAASIERAFKAGAKRIVIGSRAAGDIPFVEEMCRSFGGERIAVGIDARDGKVSSHGWTQTLDLRAEDFANQIRDRGVGAIIYTDISTDGMLKGPNLSAMKTMSALAPGKIIASGGVSCAADIVALNKIPDLQGVIMGKALYENRLPKDLRSILQN